MIGASNDTYLLVENDIALRGFLGGFGAFAGNYSMLLDQMCIDFILILVIALYIESRSLPVPTSDNNHVILRAWLYVRCRELKQKSKAIRICLNVVYPVVPAEGFIRIALALFVTLKPEASKLLLARMGVDIIKLLVVFFLAEQTSSKVSEC